MADSWVIRQDGSSYIFNINENLEEWHDGTPFDVDDIIFAYDQWRDPPGVLNQPRAGNLKLIDSMTRVNSLTLKIDLKEPFGDFLSETANGWHLILPQHVLESNFNTIPSSDLLIGTGPYEFQSTDGWQTLTTVRNPNYYRSAPDGSPYPYLDALTTHTFGDPNVEIAALRSWSIDASIGFQENFQHRQILNRSPDLGTNSILPLVDIASIQLNNTAPPFDDINARKAVFYGFNKSRLIDEVSKIFPVEPISWFSTLYPSREEILAYPGYDQTKRIQHMAMANEFAESAGLKEFDLFVTNPHIRSRDAEFLAEDMWECCNVKVNLIDQGWSSMIDVVERRQYQAALGGSAPRYAGIIPIIDWMLAPEGGRNGGWNAPNSWLNAWTRAKTLPDGPKRESLFAEMERIQLEEWVPTVPYYAVSTNKFWWNYVENMSHVPQDIFSNNKFEDIWLNSSAPRDENADRSALRGTANKDNDPELVTYNLIVQIEPSKAVELGAVVGGVGLHPSGDVVRVGATSETKCQGNFSYTFDHWEGVDTPEDENPAEVTMDDNRFITAYYLPATKTSSC